MTDPAAAAPILPQKILVATLTEVLHDGSGEVPFRALVQDRSGRRLILVSRTPLTIRPGDDVHAIGFLRASDREAVPDEFLLPAGATVGERFHELSRNASVTAAGKPSLMRPGLIAWMRQGLARAGILKAMKPGVIVTRAAEHSADPVISWGLSLWHGQTGSRTAVIVDPGVLDALGLDSTRAATAKLTNSLPEADKALAQMVLKRMIRGRGAGVLTPSISKANAPLPGRDPLVILPFTPHATTASWWQAHSRLPLDSFAPRQLVSPTARQAMDFAERLAFTYAETQGLGDDGTTEGRNRQASFALAYAVLAEAQRSGRTDDVKILVQSRQAALLMQPVSSWAGDAGDAALDVADAMLQNGQLATMTPARLIESAVMIARNFSLSADDIDALQKARDFFIYGNARLRRRSDGTLDPRDAGTAFQLLASTLRDGRNAFMPERPLHPADSAKDRDRMAAVTRRLVEAVQAAKDVAYTPNDFRADPDSRRQVAALYKQDLLDTLSAGDRRPETVAATLDYEYRRHARDGVGGLPLFDRLTTLHDDSAGDRARLILEFKHRRPVELAPPASDRPTRHPTVTLTAAGRGSDLVHAFSLAPDRRIDAFRNLLEVEKNLTMQALAAGVSIADQIDLIKLAARRRDFAFAIRADGEAWAQVKASTDKGLAELVINSSIGVAQDQPKKAGELAEMSRV